MDLLVKVKNKFEAKRDGIVKALEAAREAQKNAPSAMESHSDTTRSEKEKLVTALEIELRKVEQNLKQINNASSNGKLWNVHEVKVGNKTMKCLLVPSGMGGEMIDGVMLLSVDSPLGKSL